MGISRRNINKNRKFCRRLIENELGPGLINLSRIEDQVRGNREKQKWKKSRRNVENIVGENTVVEAGKTNEKLNEKNIISPLTLNFQL